MKTDIIRRNYELYQRMTRDGSNTETTDTDGLIKKIEAMEPWNILPVSVIRPEKGGISDDCTQQ